MFSRASAKASSPPRPKMIGIAALQPDDAAALTRQPHQQSGNVVLLHRRFSAALAGKEQLGICGNRDDIRRDQRVVDQRVRFGHAHARLPARSGSRGSPGPAPASQTWPGSSRRGLKFSRDRACSSVAFSRLSLVLPLTIRPVRENAADSGRRTMNCRQSLPPPASGRPG